MEFITNPDNMEKSNTDDLFKKILENPPPLRPDMDTLEDMNRRLDQAGRRPKYILFWWLPFLLLPFIFTSIFFYSKYQSANKIIQTLKSQTTYNQIDTNIQYQVHYQYDTIINTIYKDVIIQRKIEQNPTTNKEHIPFFGSMQLSSNLAQYFNSKIENNRTVDLNNTFENSSLKPSQLVLLKPGKDLSLAGIGQILAQANDLKFKTNPTNTNQRNLSIIDEITPISFLNNRFQYLHPLPKSDHFFNLNSKTDLNKINPLWYIVPTGLQMGINWSPIGISNLPGSKNKINTVGLVGEVEFTKNTRIQFGLDYMSIPLKAESLAELNQFPSISPDNPSDIFKEIYGDFTYLQVPITFKYIFQASKKWKPSFGVGLVARLPIKEQLEYEFVSIQGGEYSNIVPLKDGAFGIKNFRGSVGVEYNFYKNYSIQGEGFYQYDFGASTNPYFRFRYGGLNLGLKYKF